VLISNITFSFWFLLFSLCDIATVVLTSRFKLLSFFYINDLVSATANNLLVSPWSYKMEPLNKRWRFDDVVTHCSRSTKLTYAEPSYVSGFDSRRRHFISVCNQPPRSTQPSTLRGTVKWKLTKGRWCSRLRSKGRHGVICRQNCDPCLSVLRGSYDDALYKSMYILLVKLSLLLQ